MKTAGEKYQEKQALLHKFVKSLENFMTRKQSDIGRDTAEDVVENIINFVLYDRDRTVIPGATINGFKQDSIAALTALQEETQQWTSDRSAKKLIRYALVSIACLGPASVVSMSSMVVKHVMPETYSYPAFSVAFDALRFAGLAALVASTLIIINQSEVRGGEITKEITTLINRLADGLLGAGHMSTADIKKALDETFWQLDHSYAPRPPKPYQSVEAFKETLEADLAGIFYLAGKLPSPFILQRREDFTHSTNVMDGELLRVDERAREFASNAKYSPGRIISTLSDPKEIEELFADQSCNPVRIQSALHNLIELCRENIAFMPEGTDPKAMETLAKIDSDIDEASKAGLRKIDVKIRDEAPEILSALPREPLDRFDVMSSINTLSQEGLRQLNDVIGQLPQPLAAEFVCTLSELDKEDLQEKVGALSSVDGVALKAFSKSISGEKPSAQTDLIADLIAAKDPKAFVDNYLSREKAPKSFTERLGQQDSRSGPYASRV